jgi:predicted P-loop ATPase
MLIEQTGSVTTAIRDADQSASPNHFNLSIAEVKAPVEPGATGVATLDREVAIAEYAAEGFIILPCCPDAPSTAMTGAKSDQKAPRLVKDGKPRRLSQPQQKATDHELLSTTNGLGIVPTGDVVILDLDTKNADHYGGVEAVHQALKEKNPALATAPTERTQSGGLHIICRLSQWPGGHKNWRLEPDGPELGEIRGAGSFTVVAPTPGYERLNEWGDLPVLEGLEGAFVGPRKKAKPQAKAAKAAAGESAEAAGQFLPLRGLISRKLQPLLSGDFGDDASLALSKLYRDANGWANLLKDMGVATDDPEALYLGACAACDRSEKAEAMVKGIESGDCIPALEQAKGNAACRDRVKALLARREGKTARATRLEAPALISGVIEQKSAFGAPMAEWVAFSGSAKDLAKTLPEAVDLIQAVLGSALKFNRLKNRYEIDGTCIELKELLMQISYEYGLKIGQEIGYEILVKLAKDNSYHPIFDYLEKVHKTHGSDVSILAGIGERHFGADNLMYDRMLTRWLIGAVARIYEPGCKNDTALFLQGDQGYKKSTYFNTLAGDWFDDSLGSAGDKDQLQKLYRGWIFEWAELESIFRKKDVSETKAFMATRIDIFRPPYGREPQEFKRSSVLCGTTNESTFLNDPTGDRRFWVIPVKRKIDEAMIAAERDRLWAAAVELYKQGEKWWLTDQEDELSRELNAEWRSRDPWEESILGWALDEAKANGERAITTSEILTRAIDIPVNRQTPKEQGRVARILRANGWKPARKRYKSRDKVSVYEIPFSGIESTPAPAPPTTEPAPMSPEHVQGWAAAILACATFAEVCAKTEPLAATGHKQILWDALGREHPARQHVKALKAAAATAATAAGN